MSGVGSTWFAGTPYSDFDGTYMIARISAASAPSAADPSYRLWQVSSSGNTYQTGSVTATAFYDTNDTAYYLNPNGFSNLYSATFNSTVNFSSTTSWFGGYGSGSGPVSYTHLTVPTILRV